MLQVRAESERSQHRNRDEARERIAALVREALVELPPRKPTRIPRGVKRRRVADKRKRAEIKNLRKAPRGED
jgi:ribosome-associated protein